jgi:hypothetical protein
LKNSLFKAIPVSFILVFLFNNILYPENKALVREIIAHESDSVFRFTYLFDDYKNKVVENKYFVNENNISYPLSRTEWIYDRQYCLLQRKQQWKGSAWESTFLIESEYVGDIKQKEKHFSVSNNYEQIEKTVVNQYENGKLLSVKSNNGAEADQKVQQLSQFIYDNANRVRIMQIDGDADVENQLKQKLQYIYNDKTGKLDSLIYFNIQGTEDTKKLLTLYFYDSSTGNLTLQIQKKWNDIASKWENQAKSEFIYNEGGILIQEIYSHHSGYFWIANTRYDYVFDSQGLLKSKIMSQPIYRQWRKIYTIEYSQIENNQPNLMESKYNFWGGNTGELVNNYIPYYFNDEISIMEASKMEIKYTTDITVVTNSVFETGWLSIYPNPSNGVFYVNTQNYYIESWQVFDLRGIVLKSEVNRIRTGVIDLTDFPDGMYMIKAMTSDNKLLKQKIIIQRNK